MTAHDPHLAPLIGLEPEVAAATAAAWEAQGADMTASGHALSDVEEVASGFTEAVRAQAAAFASAWASATAALAGRCQQQAAALRAAAQGVAGADQASGAEIAAVTARTAAV